MSELEPGDELPALRVTLDNASNARYAGASGDFNEIHLDNEFARSVGLPGRIVHGLHTMALVARAQTEAAGGPGHLKRLSVQFRGIAVPGEEITVLSTVSSRDGEKVAVSVTVRQKDRALIRGGTAELEL